jgi:uncharacterized DUF497 family protein
MIRVWNRDLQFVIKCRNRFFETERVRVINARSATAKERRTYEEGE